MSVFNFQTQAFPIVLDRTNPLRKRAHGDFNKKEIDSADAEQKNVGVLELRALELSNQIKKNDTDSLQPNNRLKRFKPSKDDLKQSRLRQERTQKRMDRLYEEFKEKHRKNEK